MVSARELGSLDASQLTGSGNAGRRRENTRLDGPVRQCAHSDDATLAKTANWAPSEGTSSTNAKMTASVVDYHAPGMGDG